MPDEKEELLHRAVEISNELMEQAIEKAEHQVELATGSLAVAAARAAAMSGVDEESFLSLVSAYYKATQRQLDAYDGLTSGAIQKNPGGSN